MRTRLALLSLLLIGVTACSVTAKPDPPIECVLPSPFLQVFCDINEYHP